MIEKYIDEVLSQVKFLWSHNNIRYELLDHIDELVSYYLEKDYSLEEAKNLALESMGDPLEIGTELNKVHNPLIGWLFIVSKWLVVVSLVFFIFSFLKPVAQNLYWENKRRDEFFAQNGFDSMDYERIIPVKESFHENDRILKVYPIKILADNRAYIHAEFDGQSIFDLYPGLWYAPTLTVESEGLELTYHRYYYSSELSVLLVDLDGVNTFDILYKDQVISVDINLEGID